MTLLLTLLISICMYIDRSFHIQASIIGTNWNADFEKKTYTEAENDFTAMLTYGICMLTLEIASMLFLGYSLVCRHTALTMWHALLLGAAAACSLFMYLGERHYYWFWYILWVFVFPSFVLEYGLNILVVSKLSQP
eukprot:GEMP01047739.1.p1 GENE.GEMP01047739.1~~GEMP01047739.1.p1  ORF type:complete len:136 (+),score=19.77 GEMP01047739.1:218-625(+)